MPFYAVHKGKRRGIYTDWLECKQNIFGVKHPIFKKFNTKEEAEHFLIHGFGTKTNQSMMDTLGIGNGGSVKTRDVTDARDNAKIDVNENDKSEPTDSENQPHQPHQPPKHIINVFTDGSLIRKKRKNGETRLLCGYGIYIPSYGLMEELRYAGTIHENKTNNRGELKAIIDGLNYILDFVEETLDTGVCVSLATHPQLPPTHVEENEKLKNTIIMLYTDSSYSKLILGDTGVKYRKAGYLVSKKSDEKVKNADMVEEIMDIRDKIAAYGMELIVKHVYAHTNLDTFEANGNRLADEYANIGANKTFTNN
jgi:ribonuclease HI